MCVSRSMGLSVEALGREEGVSVNVMMGTRYGVSGMNVRVWRER